MGVPANRAGRRFSFIAMQYDNVAVQYPIGQCREGRARLKRRAMRKSLNARPAVKYALIAGATLLWLFGLSEQLPDLLQSAKYVSISLLMVTVAVI